MEIHNNKKIELKNLEFPIRNHFQDKSPTLIDIFMICGYENIYIIGQIIKDIKEYIDNLKNHNNNNEETNSNTTNIIYYNGYGKYICKNYPSVLSSIASNFDTLLNDNENKKKYNYSINDFQYYIRSGLISPPIVYFSSDKEKINKEELKPKQYIPSIINVQYSTISYLYMFYEEKQYEKIIIFIPKIFCIVSKYPLYKTFHQICLDIYDIFKSPILQIPLEIQIYNIVNQTPPPSDSSLKLYLFPYQESNKPKINSPNVHNKKNFLDIDRLSGYNQNQINLGLIFHTFNIEVIMELYLQLLLPRSTLTVFLSQDKEKLFFYITILNTLLYPFLDSESATIIPYKDCIEPDPNFHGFFLGEEVNNKEYEKLKKEGFDSVILKPDFYIFLDDDEKKLLTLLEENKTNVNYRLFLLLKDIIADKGECDSKIKNILKIFKKNLYYIYKEIKEKALCQNYYETKNEDTIINKKIRNVFYKLNLDLSNFIFIYEKNSLTNNADNPDNLFYDIIAPNDFTVTLKSFCNGNEDKISYNLKLPRKIFSSFLSYLYCNPKENREIDYFKIIDSIYFKKDPKKSINFNFDEFYKYYFYNFDEYFSEVYNSEYINCSGHDDMNKITKHYYKYKKTELDTQLLLKYLLLLEQMGEDKIFKNENLYVSKNETKNMDILNEIEKYYLENNLFNYKEIIRLCLINYIILTIPQKKLVYLNKEEEIPGELSQITFKNFITDLFECINILKNKYIEMFLSVSYRFFNNSNETNYFFIQPYIDVYKKCVIDRNILKSEEMIIIYERFNSFADKIKKDFTSKKINDEKNKDLIDDKDSPFNLYSFDEKIEKMNEDEILYYINEEGDILIDEQIKISCKYGPKPIECNCIQKPKKLYSMIKEIMKNFYQKLEIKQYDESTFKNIAVNLLYYCKLIGIENDIPIDTVKYILLTLNK